jgi:hypothetical protein
MSNHQIQLHSNNIHIPFPESGICNKQEGTNGLSHRTLSLETAEVSDDRTWTLLGWVIGKVIPVLSYLSAMLWRHIRMWRYSSIILDPSSRWTWVTTFTPQQNHPQYPLESRLGGPQSWSGHCGKEENLVPARIRTLSIQPTARRYIVSLVK